MSSVISVNHLGKKYTVRHQQAGHPQTLREALTQWGRGAFGHLRNPAAGSARTMKEEFWALKDINFEINAGERIGIIGRNGAGKSTLLKILSRISPPTLGRAVIRGRVASLLEIGSGFHPELTGRENIYLNGAILGMSRREIASKFDQIVAFAETEKFVDTPVKHYSSGMYFRLAFAVAVHLDPEILFFDEVPMVGDIVFQKKYFGKMADIAGRGVTIIFVSHNMGIVNMYASRVLYISDGRIKEDALPHAATQSYQADAMSGLQLDPRCFEGPLGSCFQFKQILINGSSSGNVVVRPAEKLRIEVSAQAAKDIPDFRLAVRIVKDGMVVLSMLDGPQAEDLKKGDFVSRYEIPQMFLRPGHYTLGLLGFRYDDASTWLQADAIASFIVQEEYGAGYDRCNSGVVNLPGGGTREGKGA